MIKSIIKKSIGKREKLIEEVPAHFIEQVEKIQNKAADDLINYLSDMKKTGGKIDNVPGNIQMAARMRSQCRKFLRKHGYYEKVSNYGAEYNELVKLGREYYRAFDLKGNFTERDLDTLAQIKKADLDYLMNGDQAYIDTVYQNVISSVYRNRTFRDLEKDLLNLITDNVETKGILSRYSSTRATDAFAGFDRMIQNIKSNELGLTKFLYSGGLIIDSRDFCIARAGKIFTKKEIDSWEQMSWTGKNTRSSVWIALGGYNCQHILSPVTDEFEL